MKKAVFGLAQGEVQADKIVNSLKAAGFLNSDISLLAPEQSSSSVGGQESSMPLEKRYESVGTVRAEKHTKAPEGGVTGATAGGILGGSLGLLAGIGALAIPGVGPFIAAGPLLAALSGTAVGGSLGLLVGSLIGAGIPEYEAKKYESALKQGQILISVHTSDDNELNKAKEILKKEGAKDISSSYEKN